jgi:MFS family permease
MFSSLKIRDFRLYWFGMLISLIGTWIQSVAQSWLVFQLTNSAFLLGMVGFLNTIPVFLFSLLGGVVADRLNKKNILLFTQSAFMLLAFILAILTQLKLITPGQIMLIAVLNGLVMAFDGPSRQSVVVELAGKVHLLNAIALNSAAFNSARIIGPAVAGILIAVIGMSGCFYINGLSFLAVIIALLLIRAKTEAKQYPHGHIMKDLFEGLKFIKNNPTVLSLITLVGIMSLFGISYLILMPVFAKDVLGVGAKEFGILMSATGAGALAGALMLARLGDFKQKGKLLFFSNSLFCAALLLLSLSKSYFFSLVILVFVGWSSILSMSLINTLLQIIAPDNFRGRVMSAFMFTFAGVMPFGSLLSGILTQALGVSEAILISALACSIFFIAINLVYPKIRQL